MNITYIPVLNPEIVTAISLMILFVFAKMRLGYVTLLLAHITFNIPYVILSVLPKLRQLNKHLYEAALDLGGHTHAGHVEGNYPRDHARDYHRAFIGVYALHR